MAYENQGHRLQEAINSVNRNRDPAFTDDKLVAEEDLFLRRLIGAIYAPCDLSDYSSYMGERILWAIFAPGQAFPGKAPIPPTIYPHLANLYLEEYNKAFGYDTGDSGQGAAEVLGAATGDPSNAVDEGFELVKLAVNAKLDADKQITDEEIAEEARAHNERVRKKLAEGADVGGWGDDLREVDEQGFLVDRLEQKHMAAAIASGRYIPPEAVVPVKKQTQEISAHVKKETPQMTVAIKTEPGSQQSTLSGGLRQSKFHRPEKSKNATEWDLQSDELGQLPDGWYRIQDADSKPYYCDINAMTTTWERPAPIVNKNTSTLVVPTAPKYDPAAVTTAVVRSGRRLKPDMAAANRLISSHLASNKPVAYKKPVSPKECVSHNKSSPKKLVLANKFEIFMFAKQWINTNQDLLRTNTKEVPTLIALFIEEDRQKICGLNMDQLEMLHQSLDWHFEQWNNPDEEPAKRSDEKVTLFNPQRRMTSPEVPANTSQPNQNELQKENMAIAQPTPVRIGGKIENIDPRTKANPNLSTVFQALHNHPSLLSSPKFTSPRQDSESRSPFAISKPYPHGFNVMPPAPAHEAAEDYGKYSHGVIGEEYGNYSGVAGLKDAESSGVQSPIKQVPRGVPAKAKADWGA